MISEKNRVRQFWRPGSLFVQSVEQVPDERGRTADRARRSQLKRRSGTRVAGPTATLVDECEFVQASGPRSSVREHLLIQGAAA